MNFCLGVVEVIEGVCAEVEVAEIGLRWIIEKDRGGFLKVGGNITK